MGVPLTDWQFWVVTAVALWGVFAIVRTILPSRKKKADGGCPRCAAGSAACAGKRMDAPTEKLVTLGGRRR